VPLWLACFALDLESQVEGRSLVLLGLSVPDAHGYPLLTGEYAPIYASDPLEAAGLRAGDRLLRLGQEDPRGVGTLGLMARSAEMGTRGASVVYERHGERDTARIPGSPVSIFRVWLATSFAFAAAALFVMLRARPSPTVRAAFLSAIDHGIAELLTGLSRCADARELTARGGRGRARDRRGRRRASGRGGRGAVGRRWYRNG
jgi:hypothetical protein